MQLWPSLNPDTWRVWNAGLETQKSFLALKLGDTMILRTYGFGRMVSLLLATWHGLWSVGQMGQGKEKAESILGKEQTQQEATEVAIQVE